MKWTREMDSYVLIKYFQLLLAVPSRGGYLVVVMNLMTRILNVLMVEKVCGVCVLISVGIICDWLQADCVGLVLKDMVSHLTCSLVGRSVLQELYSLSSSVSTSVVTRIYVLVLYMHN